MLANRRVIAVVLPSFRVTLVRARSPDISAKEPLAVVVDDARSERTISGGVRIDEVSNEARSLGVLPGSTIASAKAKCADLRVRVLRPREASCALDALAEMLLGFGAITSPLIDRDAVLVDVTGCAHLHGGEEELLAAVTSAIECAGFRCITALASGPEIAWALAAGSRRSRVVREADTLHALGELSIDVLRLDPRTASYFHKLGISTIAQLRAVPRASLTARCDNQNLLSRVRAILDGDDAAPIVRFVPTTVIEERIDLEYGVEQHEALFFVLKPLSERISARLEGRAMLASRLEVIVELDRAMCVGSETSVCVSLPLASPIKKSTEILSVIMSRFERVPPLAAPALAVVLRAPDLAPMSRETRHLFEPESRADLALPKLASELSAVLERHAFGTLAVLDDWRIDHRSHLVPFGEPRTITLSARLISSAPEPLRIIPLARPAEGLTLLEGPYALRGLARFEQVVWWRETTPMIDWKLAWTGDAVVFVEPRGIRGFLD